MRFLTLLALIASTASCLRTTEFKCTTHGDCAATGARCEDTGYCSFLDNDCLWGRRYGELSGAYSNQCADIAPLDAQPATCATTYATLPNAGTHLYQRTTDAQSWATQRARCAADHAYLAIPDSAAELQAITTAAAAARTWVGIDDQMNEGTYVTVNGAVATFLPWYTANGEPDNASNQDCVSALMAPPSLATDRCNQTYPAVCECEP